jgi:hypothetical protein
MMRVRFCMTLLLPDVSSFPRVGVWMCVCGRKSRVHNRPLSGMICKEGARRPGPESLDRPEKPREAPARGRTVGERDRRGRARPQTGH